MPTIIYFAQTKLLSSVSDILYSKIDKISLVQYIFYYYFTDAVQLCHLIFSSAVFELPSQTLEFISKVPSVAPHQITYSHFIISKQYNHICI